jgi:hypothetical protein
MIVSFESFLSNNSSDFRGFGVRFFDVDEGERSRILTYFDSTESTESTEPTDRPTRERHKEQFCGGIKDTIIKSAKTFFPFYKDLNPTQIESDISISTHELVRDDTRDQKKLNDIIGSLEFVKALGHDFTPKEKSEFSRIISDDNKPPTPRPKFINIKLKPKIFERISSGVTRVKITICAGQIH